MVLNLSEEHKAYLESLKKNMNPFIYECLTGILSVPQNILVLHFQQIMFSPNLNLINKDQVQFFWDIVLLRFKDIDLYHRGVFTRTSNEFHLYFVLRVTDKIKLVNFLHNYNSYIKEYKEVNNTNSFPITLNECSVEELFLIIKSSNKELFYYVGTQLTFSSDFKKFVVILKPNYKKN